MILFGEPLSSDFYWDEANVSSSCIHALTFSFESFTWKSKNNCILDIGYQRREIKFGDPITLRKDEHGDVKYWEDFHNILNIQCHTVFGKEGTM